jgi:ABC-type multidrug transport system fused ATPase/permease subunit
MSARNSDSESKPKLKKGQLKNAVKIFKFIKPYRWNFIFGLIILSLGTLTFMIFPGAMGEMADAATGHSKRGFTLMQYGMVFLILLVVQAVFSYIRTILFAIVSEKGMADVRKALYEKLITQEIAFFEQRRVGELTSRITADVEQLQTAFSISLAEFIRQVIVLVAGIGIIAWLTPKLSLIMLLTFPGVVVIAIVFGRYIRKISKKRQDELANSNVIVEETFQSFSVVKSFANEWFEVFRFSKSVDQLVKVALKYAHYRGLFFVFIFLILFGTIIFILWQGARLVESGDMQVGDLFSFILYTGFIGGAIGGLGNLYTTLAGAIGATERIVDILNHPSEIEAKQMDLKNEGTPLQGTIQYQGITFAYPTRKDQLVLKGIDLEIKTGQRIALVGSSGAGKSTIIQLLLQFYQPQSGQILFDGKPAGSYDLTFLRKNIGIVPQEVLLFGGTIEENIKYGQPNATEKELYEAARQANALDFIKSFPEGMQTVVGERGIKLSGGQRQRIAIARALLKDPAILVLDEATSSLDAESEKLVQEALDILMQGRTSIIIAHRLATIREADWIYVIDEGRIVEQGTHDSLYNIENGIYRHLAQLQFDLN